jgi:predicted DNA-binding transcriptional regulator AlpA
MLDTNDEYLTGPEVDRRYKRSPQTRQRWMKDPKLGFPKPMKIKTKLYYRKSEIEAFDRRMMAAA